MRRVRGLGTAGEELRAVTLRLAELGNETNTLSKRRRVLIEDLVRRGYSHADIAEAAGVTRGRISQLVK